MSSLMNSPSSGNGLLDRLPREEFDHLAGLLESVTLVQKQVLFRIDDRIEHVHFPTTGMVSLVIVLEDGSEVEAATIGNDGMVGLTLLFGLEFSPHLVICQVPGDSLRLPTRSLLHSLERCPSLNDLIKRYAAVSLRHASQVIACNALHPVQERACRWLLMTQDRVGRDEFPLTQEFLAGMLGVRRQTVTVIAGLLQQAGLITYRRGLIRILDRPGLERATCECYGTMRDFYGRIMR